jgi:hypothetical protein
MIISNGTCQKPCSFGVFLPEGHTRYPAQGSQKIKDMYDLFPYLPVIGQFSFQPIAVISYVILWGAARQIVRLVRFDFICYWAILGDAISE